jgi:S1-C subfamily serine protease
MNYRSLLGLIGCLLLSACVSSGTYKADTPSQAPDPAAVIELGRDSTIAFVSQSLFNDSTYYAQCSGFWIGTDIIMTALHCAQGAAHTEKVRAFPQETREFAHEIVPPVKDPSGFVMHYIVEDEITGLYTKPTHLHNAKVVAIDGNHDLALLKVEKIGAPKHRWFNLAAQLPPVGSRVYVVGHPGSLYYTVMDGMISAIRAKYPFHPGGDFHVDGQLIQVFSGIYKGNSGGPVISDKGEAIGVISFIVEAPNQGFAVALPTMQKFITESRAKNLI